ncbi:antitoxin Xre/MbcA/ParS toxin-binding domain-containing protein [Pseudomonas helleri]|uniref:antitoxin Xre/MbcA/ParS toxin-binding domain-containing protein n=1 Tax=Pseudomonas helleri TaxID=1608996 RepID=UPI00333F7AB6
MLIQLDLNMNDAQALLRHCNEYQPSSGDFREDARLRESLETLIAAIGDAMSANHGGVDTRETFDPQLLDAALRLFGDKERASEWLSRPMRALGYKSPKDAPIEQALTLIGRLEHGFGA